MVLAASLEFEKNHNNQVQERPSDNIELPQVFIKRYTLLFHCSLTYGGRHSGVTPAVTICLVVQIVFMTVYDEKLSTDKVFFIINILNMEWNMNNCSNESFYIVILLIKCVLVHRYTGKIPGGPLWKEKFYYSMHVFCKKPVYKNLRTRQRNELGYIHLEFSMAFFRCQHVSVVNHC